MSRNFPEMHKKILSVDSLIPLFLRAFTSYVNMKPEFLYRKYAFIVWKWFSYIFVRSEVRVPSMQINSNRTEQAVSKPRAKVFPNWTLQSFSWPVLLYVMVHYHEAKLLCIAFFDILVVFRAKFDSNRSFVVVSAQY